jgi:hypothetical protein
MNVVELLYAVPETGADPELIENAADEIQRLQAENEALRAKLELAEACLAGDAALITGLKADLGGCKTMYEYATDKLDALHDENEVLRKDAERYWFLRKFLTSKDMPILTGRGERDAPSERDDVDFFVDATMKGQ